MIVQTIGRYVRAFEIDDADYEAVSRHRWYFDIATGYPVTCVKAPRWRSLTLHQFLLGPAPDGLEWDHENRDKLNNRRANLRAVTSTGNKRNMGLRKDSTTGIKGVSAHRDGRWRAYIGMPGKTRCKYVHLGLYDTIEAAAAAREAAEQRLWR